MHSWWISRILAIGVLCTLIAVVISTPVGHNQKRRQTSSLPCDHFLRIIAPSLFSHCGTLCAYSNWTSWETVQQHIRTTSNFCASRRYYVQQRTRQIVSVIGNRTDCNEVNQTQKICYPTNAERMIVGLGLGGSGQNIDTVSPPKPLIPTTNVITANIVFNTSLKVKRRDALLRFARSTYGSGTRCPHTNSAGEVCQDLSASRSCKRSTDEHQGINNEEHVERLITSSSRSDLSDSNTPISFNWDLHGSHFRRRRQTRCSDDDTQYVLFILDSSGSISQNEFTEMKQAVAKLVPLFCKKIKTALINFSSDIRLEYCFDCFKNTIFGRNAAKEAIKRAQYLGQCTNTGATARCVCENILDSSCGISSTPRCLDVVLITDGRSNDPTLRVCDEIRCLHNQAGINTYAIGIGGYDPRELDCIDNTSDEFGMFEYETFQEFKESIDEVLDLVTNSALSGNYHSCATRNRSFSPIGSPYGK